MDIHFISTLTPDDEARYAPVVLAAVRAILDHLPISYAVRIRTADGRVFEHAGGDVSEPAVTPHATGPVLVHRASAS